MITRGGSHDHKRGHMITREGHMITREESHGHIVSSKLAKLICHKSSTFHNKSSCIQWLKPSEIRSAQSDQPAIMLSYKIQTNGQNNASKAKSIHTVSI